MNIDWQLEWRLEKHRRSETPLDILYVRLLEDLEVKVDGWTPRLADGHALCALMHRYDMQSLDLDAALAQAKAVQAAAAAGAVVAELGEPVDAVAAGEETRRRRGRRVSQPSRVISRLPSRLTLIIREKIRDP